MVPAKRTPTNPESHAVRLYEWHANTGGEALHTHWGQTNLLLGRFERNAKVSKDVLAEHFLWSLEGKKRPLGKPWRDAATKLASTLTRHITDGGNLVGLNHALRAVRDGPHSSYVKISDLAKLADAMSEQQLELRDVLDKTHHDAAEKKFYDEVVRTAQTHNVTRDKLGSIRNAVIQHFKPDPQ